jgi:hypothetical protein
MAKINENNQIGKTVFLSYPIPNSLKEPSLLYNNDGLKNCTEQKMNTNTKIDTNVKFLLINVLNIINYI